MGRKPVMVWIHGSGFQIGSSQINMYGTDYILEKDIVFVSWNGCVMMEMIYYLYLFNHDCYLSSKQTAVDSMIMKIIVTYTSVASNLDHQITVNWVMLNRSRLHKMFQHKPHTKRINTPKLHYQRNKK